MNQNPLTGVTVSDTDLLLIIGDQTVTIAVMRQQIQDIKTELHNVRKSDEERLRVARAETMDVQKAFNDYKASIIQREQLALKDRDADIEELKRGLRERFHGVTDGESKEDPSKG